jgi:hypothetical protein
MGLACFIVGTYGLAVWFICRFFAVCTEGEQDE